MEEYTNQIIRLIEQQPGWAFAIVLSIAFLESLAVIGVLMPGWLLLLGVGALVGSGVLSFYEMALAMFLGAVIGEGLSYYLGYFYKEQIRHWRWIASHETAMQRADRFIKNYGVLSLIIGRFIGPLRAILPLVAAVSGMRQRIFWVVNIGSGIFWAPVYLIPGVLVGASLSLPQGSQEVMAVFLLAQVLFIWLSRKWWLDAKKQTEFKDRKKAQSILAALVSILLWVVLSMSPLGQSLLLTLRKVLTVVS